MNILLVEEDKEITDYLKTKLQSEGFFISVYRRVADVIDQNALPSHDMVVLGLMLLDQRGETLVRYIRRAKMGIPIIVLSSLDSTHTKVDLFKLGVDDYVTKPFIFDELLARINAVSRRYFPETVKTLYDFGRIKFFCKQNKIMVEGREVILTKREGEFLTLLVKNEGNVVKKGEILRQIWGITSGYHSNVLHALVSRLRKKIGLGDEVIKGIHGVGYSFCSPSKTKS